ncbi:glycosyltransferase [Kineococcus terrestris]|uniref:glycosyltransferase n=1 Tax=Kineococcus terrestris TaxID=2044856 RepID=UPI0034DB11E7
MSGALQRPRTAVVLPVRGHARLLDGCLEALSRQDVPVDEVVVVDDSPEESLEELPGTRVVRSRGRGPYAARNIGWRSTGADVVLFLDARTRPRPEWSRRLTEPFGDPEVALVGSEVEVLPGESLGARASHAQQFYRLRNYLARPFFRPYLPTCSLAVRRSDLEAVDGFSEVRSGGDADFCWRVLGRPGRRLVAVEDVLADWVPRDRARDYVEQNYRYGRSNHQLRLDWAHEGADLPAPVPAARLVRNLAAMSLRFARARLRGDEDRQVQQLSHSAGVCFDLGYRLAHDRYRLRNRPRAEGRRVAPVAGAAPVTGPSGPGDR